MHSPIYNIIHNRKGLPISCLVVNQFSPSRLSPYIIVLVVMKCFFGYGFRLNCGLG